MIETGWQSGGYNLWMAGGLICFKSGVSVHEASTELRRGLRVGDREQP